MAEESDSAINVYGASFRNKPTDAITIVLWVKLDDNTGTHQLFQTIGGHSMHTRKQFDLRVTDGELHWIHRNEYNQDIFKVKTVPIVVKGEKIERLDCSLTGGLLRSYVNENELRRTRTNDF